MKKIKKETLIQEIFFLTSNKALLTGLNDTEIIEISYHEIITHLEHRYEVTFHSIPHIINQLRSFEKEHSINLFADYSKYNEGNVTIDQKAFVNFSQRSFLNRHIKEKIVVGCLDLIKEFAENKNTILHIYLGSGTECLELAKILFEETEFDLHLYTHNIGIIQLYCEHSLKLDNITLHTRNGTIDKMTYLIIEEETDYFLKVKFDAIIQSPRYIIDKTLYILTNIERPLKSNISKNSQGIKILLLTLFEFMVPSDLKENKLYSFGEIEEYDYVIIPTLKTQVPMDNYISKLPLTKYIDYFSYIIYKVDKTRDV